MVNVVFIASTVNSVFVLRVEEKKKEKKERKKKCMELVHTVTDECRIVLINYEFVFE